MKKDKKLILLIILISFIVAGCIEENRKMFKKEYYPSGKLKSCGWYVNDSIPIDTLYSYYENGELLATDIFDSIGNYVLSIGYYKNGNLNELINYENGLANGFRYHFYENGSIKKRVFYLNDIGVGDAYFFYENGENYNFYNWEDKNINLVQYDSSGRITEDIRQVIFIDSFELYVDSSLKKNTERVYYELLLIISNPPKCKTKIIIDYISKDRGVVRSDSIVNKHSYFEKEKLPVELSSINILGIQYDSIKNKTIYQKSRRALIRNREQE